MRKIVAAFAVVCVAVSGFWAWSGIPVVAAQNQNTAPTIAQIQANPAAFYDQIVTLNGTLSVYVDENEFLLDDGTGQIVVDPGPPWYREIMIAQGTRISVTGQIDWIGAPGNRRGVDLDACEIVTPSETIAIRDCAFDGPPPWAGGPDRDERPRPAERDDDDADDDWYGVVEVRPSGTAGSWVIGGRTFTATERTRLDTDDGPIRVGTCVSVDFEGSRAIEIESEPARECR